MLDTVCHRRPLGGETGRPAIHRGSFSIHKLGSGFIFAAILGFFFVVRHTPRRGKDTHNCPSPANGGTGSCRDRCSRIDP
jgi:hypothetical protein